MFASKLKSESAVMIGAFEALGVYAIYNNALPNCTDIRAAAPHDNDVEASRKGAAFKSAALIGAIFLISRDLNAFIIGGVALVGIDAMYKHANGVNPGTGKLDTSKDGSIAPSLMYSVADYQDTDDEAV